MRSKLKIKGIDSREKKVKRLFIATGLSLGILASITGCNNTKTSAGHDENEFTEKTLELKEEPTKEERLQAEIKNEVKISENVLPDMKARYLEKYNKENKTDYKLENLKLVKSYTDYIIVTENGTIYTHGATPDLLYDKLHEKNINYDIDEYDRQIYKSLNGEEVLEQMLADGTPVLDGNQLENIGKKIKNSTLSNFRNVFDIGLELKNNFTKENLQKYQQSIIEFYYGEKDKEKSNTNSTKQKEKEDYEIE